ncbi:MAG: hypothetical protein FWC84_05245, partial [Alphaproteobacteria bacterium]|nr:hypothetical protein [Alphaproteobacteria bacterium]
EDLKPARGDDFARLAQFLHQYDGGECFLALLDPLSTEAPEIEGYGLGPQPFEALDQAFRKANGLEAKIGVRKISAAQCPALAFAKPYLLSADKSGLLELADRKLQIGSTLQGTIATTEPNVSLLIVDDQGLVYDLSSQLRPAPGGKGFALHIQGAAKQKTMTWLLLAIASPQQLEKPKFGSPLSGADFFADLGRQVQALDQKPAIAIQSVSIE